MKQIYECRQELMLDTYDEDGYLIDGKYFVVPVGSRWKVQESDTLLNILGNEDNIHLDRVWKSKKAKTYQWIEISKEHFKNCFVPFDGKWFSVWWTDLDGTSYEKAVYAETPSQAKYKAFKILRDEEGVFEKCATFKHFLKYWFCKCELKNG